MDAAPKLIPRFLVTVTLFTTITFPIEAHYDAVVNIITTDDARV